MEAQSQAFWNGARMCEKRPQKVCHCPNTYTLWLTKHSVMNLHPYVKCTLGKGHQTDWKLTQEHCPNPSPFLSLRGSLLYLQTNQSVSQRWAACLHKHHPLTSQRKNKETNGKTKKQIANQTKEKIIENLNQKSIVKHTKIKFCKKQKMEHLKHKQDENVKIKKHWNWNSVSL